MALPSQPANLALHPFFSLPSDTSTLTKDDRLAHLLQTFARQNGYDVGIKFQPPPPPQQQQQPQPILQNPPPSLVETSMPDRAAATTTTTTTTTTPSPPPSLATGQPPIPGSMSSFTPSALGAPTATLNVPGAPTTAPLLTVDPTHAAMVGRIAGYFQQRYQAHAEAQQRRCQAWANLQRQRCQDITRAAMLVVAWYVRDRISRRRKRRGKAFRKGLAERSRGPVSAAAGLMSPHPPRLSKNTVSLQQQHRPDSSGKTGVVPCPLGLVPKAESVRRWMAGLAATPPDTPLSGLVPDHNGNGRGLFGGGGEGIGGGGFAMMDWDEEDPLARHEDEDSRLFRIADNMIRSQVVKHDVPLFGALSFDSDSEKDEDEEDEQMIWERDHGRGEEAVLATNQAVSGQRPRHGEQEKRSKVGEMPGAAPVAAVAAVGEGRKECATEQDDWYDDDEYFDDDEDEDEDDYEDELEEETEAEDQVKGVHRMQPKPVRVRGGSCGHHLNM